MISFLTLDALFAFISLILFPWTVILLFTSSAAGFIGASAILLGGDLAFWDELLAAAVGGFQSIPVKVLYSPFKDSKIFTSASIWS